MKIISEKTKNQKYAVLKRQLNLKRRIVRESYRGERTIIILSGLNFKKSELEKTPSLHLYEEKFLFFLLLLRFSRTKVIYVSSQKINPLYIDYYLGLITNDPKKIETMKKRLTMISLGNLSKTPVAAKLLQNKTKLKEIKTLISDPKSTFIQCYNPLSFEKEVALELSVPLYGLDENLSYHGTKSGSINAFKKCKINYPKAYINLKNRQQLVVALSKLICEFPSNKKAIIKIEDYPAGEGNVIFNIKDFLLKRNIQKMPSQKKVASLLDEDLELFCQQSEKLPHKRFSYYFKTINDYMDEFSKTGGIVQLYVDGAKKTSPSCQLRILPDRKIRILSTHEQVLGGADKTEYIGCFFPANETYRRNLTLYSKKVGGYLAKKGVIGRLAVDYLAVDQKDKKGEKDIYAIEINIRKGGTTHPYILARSATGALYNQKSGLLSVGKTNIYYYATDNAAFPRLKKLTPESLIKILDENNLDFNRERKSGIIVHLFGMIQTGGRIGLTCVGKSRKEVMRFYDKFYNLMEGNGIQNRC